MSNWTIGIFIYCITRIIFSLFLFKMPPPKHSLTKYITVLTKKSNKYNNYALCYYCKTKIINIKRLVIFHLKSCKKFEEQHNEDKRNRILFTEKYEKEAQIDKKNFFSLSLSYGIFFKLPMIFLQLVKLNN